MQICQDHWSKLKDAIRERGLYSFVAKSGEAAAEEIKAQLERTVDETKPYDPLMSANWGIVTHAIEIEPSLTFSDCCPLCELDKVTNYVGSGNWINGCTDDILADFRKHGWVSDAS